MTFSFMPQHTPLGRNDAAYLLEQWYFGVLRGDRSELSHAITKSCSGVNIIWHAVKKKEKLRKCWWWWYTTEGPIRIHQIQLSNTTKPKRKKRSSCVCSDHMGVSLTRQRQLARIPMGNAAQGALP